jgi:hypothetical protein
MFKNFLSQNRAFYEIMWKNMVEPNMSLTTKYEGAENTEFA